MSEMRGLIGSMSRKWKIDHGTSKKLEIENKLMEERLNQLKNEMNKEKEQRSARGAASWSRGQTGPLSSYGKNVLQAHKANTENLLANKPTKIKILKDEIIPVPPAKGHRDALNKEKSIKCGQCEKKFAFVHCVECSEDYCINCFSSFHSKGALKKHRSIPFNSEGRIKTPIIDVMPSPPTSAKPDRQQKTYDVINSSRQTSSNVSERRIQPHHVQFAQETKLFNVRNGSAGSDRSDNQVYYEMNDGDYDNEMEAYEDDVGIGSSVGAGGDGGGLLLDGNFNENESHEEFKRAVLEWRNGGNKSATQENNSRTNKSAKNYKKNVDVGTDNSAEQRKSSLDMQQNIELQINFNHSLSYAERLLLKKYRRTDVEEFFNVSTQLNTIEDENPINLNSSVKMSRDRAIIGQQHIDFNQLMKVLQVDGEPIKEIENLEAEYTKRLNEPVRESLVYTTNDEKTKLSIQFEEIGSSMKSVNLENMKIRQNTLLNEIKQKEERLNNIPQVSNDLSLDLRLNSVPKSAKHQNTSTTSRTQQNSARKTSARQNSARVNSARKNNEKEEFESHLTQKPSDILKSIADRELPINTLNNNTNSSDLSNFFLLSVDNKELLKSKENQIEEIPSRPASAANKNTQKISYKLYEMSPRSWRPNSSLANNEIITSTTPKIDNNNNNNNNQAMNNNNIKQSTKASIEKIESTNISFEKETKIDIKNNNLLSQSNNNKNSNNNSNSISSITKQSTSSSLTTVSKDYDSVMRNSGNYRNNNNNSNSASNSKQETNRSIENKVLLKSVPLNKTHIKLVNKKNDTIEFKLSKGLQIKPSSSVASSTNSTLKNSTNSMKFSKPPSVRTKSNLSRPQSILSRCETPSNPQNIEFAEQFSTYDDDDGRSSRMFQNEDDDEYFNELGNEFTKSGNISFNAHHDKPPTAEETALLKLISNKNQLTQADLSDLLRGNYEEDEECNSDLDLEDLKSLK